MFGVGTKSNGSIAEATERAQQSAEIASRIGGGTENSAHLFENLLFGGTPGHSPGAAYIEPPAQTKERMRLSLQTRSQLTTPRTNAVHVSCSGPAAPGTNIPTQQRQGKDGAQYPGFAPIESACYTNPATCVEGVALPGWVQGGIPTRQDYVNQ
jgi:hypothetical protein